jgi:hypothetical protein
VRACLCFFHCKPGPHRTAEVIAVYLFISNVVENKKREPCLDPDNLNRLASSLVRAPLTPDHRPNSESLTESSTMAYICWRGEPVRQPYAIVDYIPQSWTKNLALRDHEF